MIKPESKQIPYMSVNPLFICFFYIYFIDICWRNRIYFFAESSTLFCWGHFHDVIQHVRLSPASSANWWSNLEIRSAFWLLCHNQFSFQFSSVISIIITHLMLSSHPTIGAIILLFLPSLNAFVLLKILIQEGVEINARIQLQCFPFSVQHDLHLGFLFIIDTLSKVINYFHFGNTNDFFITTIFYKRLLFLSIVKINFFWFYFWTFTLILLIISSSIYLLRSFYFLD